MRLPLLLAALTPLIGACTSTHSVHLRPSQHRLLETTTEEGDDVAFTLVAGGDGVPAITRTLETSHSVATLGVQVRSIDHGLAQGSGLAAWRGVRVERVVGNSPAARAGILQGDVLLSLDDAQLSTPEQLADLLQSKLEPGGKVRIGLLQVDPEGGYAAEASETTTVLGSKEVRVSKSETTRLDTHLGIFRLTGLQVGTLTPELGREIYGSEEPVVLVAGALVGSPAYHAGLRSGDRVLSCEGAAVTSHDDIGRAVLARTEAAELPASWFDAETRRDVESAEGEIRIEVDGPLGRHSTALGVDPDLGSRFHFNVPILYDYKSRVDRSSTSFLDFIFQFGFNYESRYLRSSTRATREDSLLSILPFGMFEFESTEDKDRYCFFWFIEFTDRR